MDLLWKKESVNDNALYSDLFVDIKSHFPEFSFYNFMESTKDIFENVSGKKNAFSDANRKSGNEKFTDGKWAEAMKLYNDSLRYAESNTENVPLAYANRSACFFHLKMYDECLKDIELADKSNCPDRLKSKLQKRKNDCFELLQSKSQSPPKEFDVKLSYDADDNFPFMANILDIKRNDEFGRHIISKCDIPAGKIVSIEENFITRLRMRNGVKCITCHKIPMNPIPCVKCVWVMFCNTDCINNNKIHQMDCGAHYYLDENLDSRYTVQSIIAAVNLFLSVESLIEFVEDAVASEKFEIPKSVVDQKSTYRMFLKLHIPSKLDDFVRETYKLYQTIMRNEQMQKLFHSTMKQRFLMHLAGHHLLNFIFNSSVGQMCVFTSLFSHSCVPNIQELYTDTRTAFITIRPIKRDEQLYVTYVQEQMVKLRNADGKSELYKTYGFRCRCPKCKNQLTDSREIQRDFLFNEINNIEIDPKTEDVLWNLSEKCIQLLNKYKNLPLSQQLIHVSKRLALSIGLVYELRNCYTSIDL